MNTTRSLFVAVVCIGVLFVVGAGAASEGVRQVHIALHDRADIDWVHLSIEGETVGIVRKNQPLVLTLRTGASYLFRVWRSADGQFFQRERLQLIEAGRDPQWVILNPERQNPDSNEVRGFLNISFTAAPAVDWANITINGISYGMIQRNETRRFWLRAGVTHRVRLERSIDGRVWFTEQSIEVREGEVAELRPTLR